MKTTPISKEPIVHIKDNASALRGLTPKRILMAFMAAFIVAVSGLSVVSAAPDTKVGNDTIAFMMANTRLPDESSKHYRNYHQTRSGTKENWNNQTWDEGTRSVEIAGKVLVFDDQENRQLLQRFNGHEDIKSLNIYAEKVIVRTRLKLPSTEVHIYAEELRFEDVGTTVSAIDTTPVSLTIKPNQFENGKHGLKAGDIHVLVDNFYSQDNRGGRFIQNGGKGQDGGPGEKGTNGKSAVLFSNRHRDLIECGEKWGIGKQLVRWGFLDAEVTLSELKQKGIQLGSAWPEDGGDAKAGGKAGNGGDAGSFYSNQENLDSFVEQQPGSRGRWAGMYLGGRPGYPRSAIRVGYAKCESRWFSGIGRHSSSIFRRGLIVRDIERRESKYGAFAESPLADRPQGNKGSMEIIRNKPMVWLHPHAVEMAIAYADDAFQLGLRDIAQEELEVYLTLIEEYKAHSSWDYLNDEDTAMFSDQESRIRSLLNRLNFHEDYYGNPQSWVPALSLEANKLLFEQEAQWAIRTIYVADWVTNENNRQKNNANALAEARRILREEILSLEGNFNQALDRVPPLKLKAKNIAVDIADVQAELQAVEQILIERARRNVEERNKVPFWKKGLKVLGALAKVVPVGQPVLGGVGKSLDLIATYDEDKPWDTIKGLPDVVEEFAKSEPDKKAKKVKDKKDDAKLDEEKDNTSLKKKITAINKSVKQVIDDLDKHKDLFKEAGAPKEEVEVELEKLKKADPEFKRLAEDVQQLLAEKENLAKELTEVLETLETSLVKINQNYMNIADLLPKLEGSSRVVLSQKSALALQSMKSRAIKRLQRYQYWVAKAFEYRTLRPYEGDLTLTDLFLEVSELVNHSAGDGRLSAADYERLYVLYRDDLSTIIDAMVQDYNDHVAGFQTEIEYRFTADEIEALNTGGPVPINLWEKGLFGNDEEDVRIVSLEVADLTPIITGTSHSFARLDLRIKHSGLSRIWRNDEVHAFQHYNKQNKQPMMWTSRYQNGVITNHQLSASTKSLIHALLEDNDVDIMLFSRPSAWATLSISKTVKSDGNLHIDVDDLLLRVTYDYVPANGSLSRPWESYREEQDESIQKLYNELLDRDADRQELVSHGKLLDIGYSTSKLSDLILRPTTDVAPRPEFVDPIPGTVLSGAKATFNWSPNDANVTGYWIYVGTYLGGADLFKKSLGTSESVTVTGLPEDGSEIFVRLWYRTKEASTWKFIETTYLANIAETEVPEIVGPPPGSTLRGSTLTFKWRSNGANVTDYGLNVGTSRGGRDLFRSGALGKVGSVTVSNLPKDGSTLFVRLWYRVNNGAWKSTDYQYTAGKTTSAAPALVSPVPGSTLRGSTLTFKWRSDGATVTDYGLNVGTSRGGRDLFRSGALGKVGSVTVSNLPKDGSTLFVRLWYRVNNGAWKSTDYQYTAGKTTSAAPALVSPVPGSPLRGSTLTFKWRSNGTNVTDYGLNVGTSRGGRDLFRSGALGKVGSVTVSNLPKDGSTLFVRLWYRINNGAWKFIDYQYTAGKTTSAAPALVTPVPGSTLRGSTLTFKWRSNGATATDYGLNVGTSRGGRDLFRSGALGEVSSVTVSNLPKDGSTIFVRLWYRINNGAWKFIDYKYIARR